MVWVVHLTEGRLLRLLRDTRCSVRVRGDARRRPVQLRTSAGAMQGPPNPPKPRVCPTRGDDGEDAQASALGLAVPLPPSGVGRLTRDPQHGLFARHVAPGDDQEDGPRADLVRGVSGP